MQFWMRVERHYMLLRTWNNLQSGNDLYTKRRRGIEFWLLTQTLEYPFSAVSKPILQLKDHFKHLNFQDLQLWHAFAPHQTQLLQLLVAFRNFLMQFPDLQISLKIHYKFIFLDYFFACTSIYRYLDTERAPGGSHQGAPISRGAHLSYK